MAKVTSPLFGFEAKGRLGDNLTLCQVKGQTIVKAKPTHPDAETPAQLAQRAKFKACATRWHTLSAEELSHCRVCADQLGITPYNYFLKECIAGRY